jgi:putative oxidoreductase
LAFCAIAAELVGSLGLVAGFLGRIGAFGIAMNMTVAIATVHFRYGFFMNWSGNQKGEGFEFHLLALTLAAIIILQGAGKWSVDRYLTRQALTPQHPDFSPPSA